MKKEYDYTMTEADLKKRPVWSLGEIRVAVSENGDPSKIDVFKIYHKDKKTTTYAEYERLLGLAEKDRFRMITDIRRRIYQLFARVQKGNIAFKYTLNDFRTGFECNNIDSVARRLGDCKNNYNLTDRCDWDWKSAKFKIYDHNYFLYGKKYTEETLFIDVSKEEYGETATLHYNIPMKFLHPKYDFENDPVYKDNVSCLKTDAVYDELFRHNSLTEEAAILEILRDRPDVMFELQNALGKEKTKGLHEWHH